MKKQLLRLFILIVASCGLIVWSFNLIYSASDQAYGYALDAEELLQQGQLGFRDLAPESIAFAPELKAQLAEGKVIALRQADDRLYFYTLIGDKLREMGPVSPRPGDSPINLLIPLLYASLALTILLLIGRVFRDLSLLQRQAIDFGRQPKRMHSHISKRSAIYPLAQGFETMTRQIVDFIQLHRDLSRTMSHEIRTPLARMRFVLELTKGQLPANYAARLSEDIDQIEALSQSYLTFARVEHHSGSQGLWVDADDWLQTLAENFSIYGEQVQLLTHCDCRASDGKVWLIPLGMELAGQNLIANALRYAQKQIRISLMADASHWTLMIEDDGQGFGEGKADLKKAFRRGESENSAGFGLGLYIVRKIAIWHQGKLRVEDSVELGGAAISLRWRRPAL
ncbi:ATP-binding protein [Shewanella cyperi]|uniref:ATP-binding protein n=1 Tax=Shewanella cyperi TaxID=2814292 RepID=UPI001A93D9DD|nr:ATP-binding protein [Shewanella cyperi]QSX41354.1 two-component sensor histidine kinase [Shewanella cyperi]